jgi:hypothetical protein
MTNDGGVTFIDDPHAPDIFAGAATGFFNLGGVIMITLETPHVDHSSSPGPINRVVTGRLVMPLVGAQGLAVGLFNFLKSQGLDPAWADESGPSVQ